MQALECVDVVCESTIQTRVRKANAKLIMFVLLNINRWQTRPHVFVMYLGGRVRSLESTAIDLLSVLQKVQSSSGVRLIAHPSEKEMCIFGWALGSAHPSEKRCTLGDRRIGSRHYVAANTFGWMQCSRRSLNGDDDGKVVGWAVDVMMAVGGGLLCNYCVPSGQISFGGTYFS